MQFLSEYFKDNDRNINSVSEPISAIEFEENSVSKKIPIRNYSSSASSMMRIKNNNAMDNRSNIMDNQSNTMDNRYNTMNDRYNTMNNRYTDTEANRNFVNDIIPKRLSSNNNTYANSGNSDNMSMNSQTAGRKNDWMDNENNENNENNEYFDQDGGRNNRRNKYRLNNNNTGNNENNENNEYFDQDGGRNNRRNQYRLNNDNNEYRRNQNNDYDQDGGRKNNRKQNDMDNDDQYLNNDNDEYQYGGRKNRQNKFNDDEYDSDQYGSGNGNLNYLDNDISSKYIDSANTYERDLHKLFNTAREYIGRIRDAEDKMQGGQGEKKKKEIPPSLRLMLEIAKKLNKSKKYTDIQHKNFMKIAKLILDDVKAKTGKTVIDEEVKRKALELADKPEEYVARYRREKEASEKSSKGNIRNIRRPGNSRTGDNIWDRDYTWKNESNRENSDSRSRSNFRKNKDAY